MKIKFNKTNITLSLPVKQYFSLKNVLEGNALKLVVLFLSVISIVCFYYYYENGIGVAYNDARSHLDIGRRVVEGLTPGLAQLGSVWLPLPHILMAPTVWNDFFWHSGLSGALQSMASFVVVGVLIFQYLKNLKVGLVGRLVGLLVFVANINVLYLQSTAMTELLLLATMTAGAYYLMLWAKEKEILHLIKSAFMVMVSTLVRYDGWFLLAFITVILSYTIFRKKGYRETEGVIVLFLTMASFGILLWLIWNLLIFNDPLYFAFGPFSAHSQQQQIEAAGELWTKGNLLLSLKTYFYAVGFNTYVIPLIVAGIGAYKYFKDKKIRFDVRFSGLALISPLFFNVLALYLGHSVLFVQGIVGDVWFNVRYGMMLMPAIAIFIGYLIDRVKSMRWVYIGLLTFVILFAFVNSDAVTIDDALTGASGKNVAEVSSWLRENAADKEGFVLISVASHDAIIFSSGLPMSKYIHEGTGKYWEAATDNPDKWARWIVLRTHDMNDWTFREVKDTVGFKNFELVDHYPFADIYQLRDEYVDGVQKEPVIWD